MKSAAPKGGASLVLHSHIKLLELQGPSGQTASKYFKALWSVSRTKGFPNRRVRWFSVAQTTAKHSLSVVVYFCWALSSAYC